MSFLYTTNGKYEQRKKSIKFNFFSRDFTQLAFNFFPCFFYIFFLLLFAFSLSIHFNVLKLYMHALERFIQNKRDDERHTQKISQRVRDKQKSMVENPINEKLWLSISWSSCAIYTLSSLPSIYLSYCMIWIDWFASRIN